MTLPRSSFGSAAALALALTAAVLLGACGGGGDDEGSGTTVPSADRQTVVTGLVDDVLAPTLRDAASTAAAAQTAIEGYCAAPSPATQQAAAAATADALYASEKLDPIDMGPAMLQRTDGHVAYPTDTERVEEQLASSPATDRDSISNRTPSSVRGFTAASYLLTSSPAPGDDLARCAFLVAIVNDAALAIDEVAAASFDAGDNGSAPYFDRLRGIGNDGEPPKETTDVMVNMALSVLDTDAGLLADPGDQSPEAVRRAASAHLATIAALWDHEGAGLNQLAGDDLSNRFSSELGAAQAALDDPSVDPAEAQAAVEAARATLGTEVVSALDVVVGFSENDGDS